MQGIVIRIIKTYKLFVSPILPQSCRFYPTCSIYAITAIKKYGLMKGTIMSIWRILRCHPFNPGGVDLP
ncbi:MAG: membrane protein insertion efficiency factor YidD [Thermodesulfobacteriota bacterium]|nr:membrane protein insertion efficiency factor YidD [Thermodesulfobacteriota bacterium]